MSMVGDGTNLDVLHGLGSKELEGVAGSGAHVGQCLVGLLLDVTIINLNNKDRKGTTTRGRMSTSVARANIIE